jgi:hypothetical protein
VKAAQAHFDGLTMLLEMKDSVRGGIWKGYEFADELTERYIIL